MNAYWERENNKTAAHFLRHRHTLYIFPRFITFIFFLVNPLRR